MHTKQFKLYLLVLVLIFCTVIVALGGGLFGQQQPWMLQWQHQAFASLCHQMPSRSFWINGQPMAVCSRCFGIYSGFLVGWVLLPLLTLINMRIPFSPKKMLILAFFINLIDVIGNLLGFWHNTLISRWVLGVSMGIAAAILFSGTFFNKNKRQKQEHYGRITISGTGT